MTKLRIFLADDHAVVRAGLKALIDAQPDMEVVGEASDGRNALRQVADCRPDVVVMDISMPDLNGTNATDRLKRECPGIAVLTLSVHEEIGYIRQLLQAGASGYVLKRSAADTLIAAIRMVADGGTYLDPAVAGKLVAGSVGRPATTGALPVQLSEREADVLRLIARGYSNREIATQLDVSVKTVETYKTRAMQKLGIDNRVAIVHYAMQQGWLQ